MLILDKHKAVERMLALAWAAPTGAQATAPEALPASPRSRPYRRIAVYERRPARASRGQQPRAMPQPLLKQQLPQSENGAPARRASGVPLSPNFY